MIFCDGNSRNLSNAIDCKHINYPLFERDQLDWATYWMYWLSIKEEMSPEGSRLESWISGCQTLDQALFYLSPDKLCMKLVTMFMNRRLMHLWPLFWVRQGQFKLICYDYNVHGNKIHPLLTFAHAMSYCPWTCHRMSGIAIGRLSISIADTIQDLCNAYSRQSLLINLPT